MPDLPTELSVTVGGSARVTLPDHGSGGYRWTVEVSGDAASASVEYDEMGDAEPSHRPGARLGQVLVVTGLQAGDALLALTERRSWETGPGVTAVPVHVHVEDREVHPS